MHRRTPVLLIATTLLVLALSCREAPARSHGYRVVELPIDGPGRANAVSDRGDVAGELEVDGRSTALLWYRRRPGRVNSPRELPPLPGDVSSRALDVNNRRQVVGVSLDAAGRERAVLWTDDQVIDLGTLGGPASRANALNDRDLIVGRAETAEGHRVACVWEDRVPRRLEVPNVQLGSGRWVYQTEGPLRSEAADVNARGQVTGMAFVDHFHYGELQVPFLWDGRAYVVGGYSDTWVQGVAINDRGIVAGHSHHALGPTAWRWRPAGSPWPRQEFFLWDLGLSVGGINDEGTMVGSYWKSPPLRRRLPSGTR